MRGRYWFLGGVGVGYLLGARAGRERFDQISRTVRRAWESPTVQEAAGLVQAQTTKLYAQGKQVVGGRLRGAGEDLDGTRDAADEEWDSGRRRRELPANSF